MKTYSVAIVATAFTVLTSAIGCGTTPGPAPTPLPGDQSATTLTLTGRVVDATMADDTGVAEAVVTVSRDSFSTSAVTDGEGYFAIGGLEAGEYMVSVNRDGYFEAAQAVRLDSDQSITCFIDRESDGSNPTPERKARLVFGKKAAPVKR